MSLYKRKDSPHWWVKLSHNGRTLQRSAGTSDRRKAQEYHDKLKAELWDVERLGVKPCHTWEEAVLRFLEEKGHKASARDDRRNFRWLDQYLAGRDLVEINRDMVERIAQARKKGGVANGTVNRTLALLRSVLRAAANEWEWIDRAPKVRLLSEPKRRVRYLTEEQAVRLLGELPGHLAAVALFALLTGLRQGNILGLRWSQVDLERRLAWIHADEAKGRKAISVPLVPQAVEVVAAQRGRHPEFVFTFRGQPIGQATTKAWYAALARAGIEQFRFHDLRHTWATWHVQKGTPIYELRELGGWESAVMVERYAHLSARHLAERVDQFASRLSLTTGDVLATQKEVIH